MDVVTISGSPSARSRSTGLLAHVSEQLRKHGFSTRSIIVRDLPPEDILFGRFESQAIKSAGDLIDSARGIVIATPIYKGAVAGVLKAFLDLLKPNSLEGKVVLPLGLGGSAAHLLAVDYSLRPVLAALGATQVLNTIYATDKQVNVGEDGNVVFDDEVALRLADSVQKLVRVIASDARPARPASPRRSVANSAGVGHATAT